MWPGGPRARPGDGHGLLPKREVNSVLPADPEASSLAWTTTYHAAQDESTGAECGWAGREGIPEVVEHLEDPIQGLPTFLRVVRPGGIVFLSLPDARYTCDAARERTTIDHVVCDHHEGPVCYRRWHYEEWAPDIEGCPVSATARLPRRQ